MKRYLIKIVLFFIAVAVIDCLFGYACQYMNSHTKGGGTRSRYYVCKESNEEVLIFGSSRAKHHYVPDIIEDSLGMSCYNTGEDGNGIIFCYGVLKMITNRYKPKMIIYDVSSFDIYKDDNMKYLDLLKSQYNEPGIDSIFWSVEPKTRLMMCSNLYRYNTNCLRIAGSFIRPMTSYPKGYSALKGMMDYEPQEEESKSKEVPVVDDIKIHYFEQFIKIAKYNGIELICCVSPNYKGATNTDYYEPIKNLCSENEVPFYFLGYSPEISPKKHLFQDRIHLNDEGARMYTSMIANIIKEK